MLVLPLTSAGDVYYIARASKEIIAGGLIYRDVEFTYPPVYAYLMAAAMLILGDNAYAWKILPIIFHLATGLLIFRHLRSWAALYLYIFSPLPFLASSVWGSFDVVAGFFMVMALVLIDKGQHVMSALSLAIGINVKYCPVVLLIPILSYLKKGRGLYVAVVVIASLFVNFPFMILAWSEWFQQAVLFQLVRVPSGYSFYNLLTGTLSGGPSEVGLALPLGLLLLYFASYSRRDKVLQTSALFMTVAVLINKVVLWYAQWFVPLVVLCYRQTRRDFLLISALLLSQIFVYAGPTMFGNQLDIVLELGWLYQVTTAVLTWRLFAGFIEGQSLSQLAHDRLLPHILQNPASKHITEPGLQRKAGPRI